LEKEHIGNRLKSRRIKHALTIDEVASEAGISRQYLKRIENCEVKPSENLEDKLYFALRHLQNETNIELIVDYLRIRFETTDVIHIIEDLLHMDTYYMQLKDRAFYTYESMYVFGGITVMYSQDIKKGVLLELKGQGCRQFEGFLYAQKRSWEVFLREALEFGGIMKRWDIAVNDIYGILDIPELSRKCHGEEKTSVFKTFIDYRSGNLMKSRDQHKKEMGYTLYIGSMKSDVYFCVYEKDYEQYIKYGIPLEESPIKNRFEIRLKDKRAEKALNDFLLHGDIGKTAFAIINRYITFLEEDKKKCKVDWDIDERWDMFIGEERRKLRLTEKPEPYSFERTVNWIKKQVAPSLKTIEKVDEINGTTTLADLIKDAHMKENHQKILEQQTIPISEMIKM